ncbi:hypothetical protein GE09DRAFT_1066591 [Coniochaeta sp. 2T2.1]|nr:hypothetical protein GE09DRAFT_1066591 [Coniochaeta sp. 2T2.1]
MEEGTATLQSPSSEALPRPSFTEQLGPETSNFDMGEDFGNFNSDFNPHEFEALGAGGSDAAAGASPDSGITSPEPRDSQLPPAQLTAQDEEAGTVTADATDGNDVPSVDDVELDADDGLFGSPPPAEQDEADIPDPVAASPPPAPTTSRLTFPTDPAQPTTAAPTSGLSFPPVVVQVETASPAQTQAPEPIHEAVDPMMTVLTSALPDLNSTSTSVIGSTQSSVVPGPTTTDYGLDLTSIANMDDADLKLLLALQQATAAPTVAEQIHAPQPTRPHQTHQVVSATQSQYPAVSAPGYMPQPTVHPTQIQNTVSIPVNTMPAINQTVPGTVYAAYQQPPVTAQPMPGSSALPPPSQLVTNHLTPNPTLYQGYGSTPSTKSTLKRPREDDEEDSSPSSLPRRPTKQIRHRRDNNRRESNDPKNWYPPPPATPNWGPFNYTPEGEWLGNVLYSADQLATFLVGPSGDGRCPSRREKLTLFLQCRPAFDAHRYGPDASVCRYKDCSVKKNTITKGQWRVAFDERASLTGGGVADPFKVAGYMHLYCFEEVFALITLMLDEPENQKVTVRADDRVLPCEERNPMALDARLVHVFDTWRRSQEKRFWECYAAGRDLVTPRKQRLWSVLTEALVSTPGYLEKLEKNEFHIGKYMGDLRLYQSVLDKRLQDQREARVIVDLTADEDEYEEKYSIPTPSSHHGRPVAPLPSRPGRRPTLALYQAPGSSRRRSRLDGHGQAHVAASPPRRPDLVLYSPPGRRKRAREEYEYENQSSPKRYRVDTGREEYVQPAPTVPSPSPPRRPDQPLYTPPNRRKRSYRDGESADRPPVHPTKRLRVVEIDTAQIQKTVQKHIVGQDENHKKNNNSNNLDHNKAVNDKVRRVSRLLTEMVPDVSGLPTHKQREIRSLVSKEAERVRSGVERRWASLPG